MYNKDSNCVSDRQNAHLFPRSSQDRPAPRKSVGHGRANHPREHPHDQRPPEVIVPAGIGQDRGPEPDIPGARVQEHVAHERDEASFSPA